MKQDQPLRGKKRWMRTLAIFVLAFGLFTATASLAFAEGDNNDSNKQDSTKQHDKSSDDGTKKSGYSGDENGGYGVVPEVPYAALMPISLLLAAVIVYRKKLRTQ